MFREPGVNLQIKTIYDRLIYCYQHHLSVARKFLQKPTYSIYTVYKYNYSNIAQNHPVQTILYVLYILQSSYVFTYTYSYTCKHESHSSSICIIIESLPHTCLSMYPCTHVPMYLCSMYLCIYASMHLSIYLPIYQFHPSINLSIYQSIYQSINLSNLSIYQSMNL